MAAMSVSASWRAPSTAASRTTSAISCRLLNRPSSWPHSACSSATFAVAAVDSAATFLWLSHRSSMAVNLRLCLAATLSAITANIAACATRDCVSSRYESTQKSTSSSLLFTSCSTAAIVLCAALAVRWSMVLASCTRITSTARFSACSMATDDTLSSPDSRACTRASSSLCCRLPPAAEMLLPTVLCCPRRSCTTAASSSSRRCWQADMGRIQPDPPSTCASEVSGKEASDAC
mmetsp:Transcript_2081/g.3914  ORF Transcript_2081/g.3914 Transcript_2081/m.3914 type:complete len:234 (+) Transcript_2081:75-776(+)